MTAATGAGMEGSISIFKLLATSVCSGVGPVTKASSFDATSSHRNTAPAISESDASSIILSLSHKPLRDPHR